MDNGSVIITFECREEQRFVDGKSRGKQAQWHLKLSQCTAPFLSYTAILLDRHIHNRLTFHSTERKGLPHTKRTLHGPFHMNSATHAVSSSTTYKKVIKRDLAGVISSLFSWDETGLLLKAIDLL